MQHLTACLLAGRWHLQLHEALLHPRMHSSSSRINPLHVLPYALNHLPHSSNAVSPCLCCCAAAVQAAALVPAAQRPFVPFRARAFCTQQQRQQVAGRLLGGQLVLLLQELRVPPQQQELVRQQRLVWPDRMLLA